MLINMKPYVTMPFSSETIQYTVGISSNQTSIDQKRNVIDLLPGYHTIITVNPQLVGVSEYFVKLGVGTRNCKLPHETDGLPLNIVNKYTRAGCELECAAHKAIDLCRCKPWYYTNDFLKTPICDMFGGYCFEQIMSNEKYYKMCPDVCIEDCEGMFMAVSTSYLPLDSEDLCKQGSLIHEHFKQYSRRHFPFEHYEALINSNEDTSDSDDKLRADLMKMHEKLNLSIINHPKISKVESENKENLLDELFDGSICKKFVQKYVGLVVVQSPANAVPMSIREVRVTFIDQIGIIGGMLGLFTGWSLISLLEVFFVFHKFIKRTGMKKRNDVEKPSNKADDKTSPDIEMIEAMKTEIATNKKVIQVT